MDAATKRKSKKLLALAGKRTGGAFEEAQRLLEAGADASYGTHEEGWTALHDAICADDRELARLLVEHGADPEQPLRKEYWDETEFIGKGTTPLQLAEELELDEMVALLRAPEAGAEGAGEPQASSLTGRWRAHTIRYESSPDDDPAFVPTDRPAEGDEVELELRADGACSWSFYGKTRTGAWERDGDTLHLRVDPQTVTLRLDGDVLRWTDYDEEHGSEVVTTLRKQ
jgi:hypothetical protein